jgi:hypothetical protein
VGEEGDLGTVVEIEFGEYAGNVGFHGGQAHEQLARDLGVGLAPPDGDGDLAFAFAELIQRGGGVPLPGGGAGSRSATGWVRRLRPAISRAGSRRVGCV